MTTATLATCKNCLQEIKEGELVKVTWNNEQDEHISCPPIELPPYCDTRNGRQDQ